MTTKSRTLSASLPEPIYRRAREVAREEGRRQSAVVADALQLYASLTPTARRVMESLAKQYGSGALDRLQAELSRALLRARWEGLAAETARALPPDLARLADDDLARAVQDEVAAGRRDQPRRFRR